MYTSPDEDRSDLFLAAGVFVLGPELLGVILRRIPFPEIAIPFVMFVVTVLTTIAVPLWLMRYRKQRLSELGFAGPTSTAGRGLLVALPIAAAYVIASFIGEAGPLGVPVFNAVTTGAYVQALLTVVGGLCVAFLLIYTTVKARTAFRADAAYIKPTMLRLARYTAIGAAVTTGLLLLTYATGGVDLSEYPGVVLPPLGVAAAGWWAHSSARGSQLTSRNVLLTPMVLLAIGSFVLFGPAISIVVGLWLAALLAGVGLVFGALLESSRSPWAPLGFAAVLALLTPLFL